MDLLIPLNPDSNLGLQHQIRQKMVEAILSGTIPAGERIISSRKLSRQLKIARNTVVLAYNQLVDEGYLISRERSGLFVNRRILEGRIGFSFSTESSKQEKQVWRKKIKISDLGKQQFTLPEDWQNHPYPFIDGNFDASLYPVAQWQEASRLAFGGLQAHHICATSDADDSMLISQIRSKILPRRGINAAHEEILITSGSQHALYLLTQLLCDKTTKVAMENPGSKALRSCLALTHCNVYPQPIDEKGLLLDVTLEDKEIIFVTPSQQQPTAVTMPMERRLKLIAQANQFDQTIVEDDSECESNYFGEPQPALKSLAKSRVIYVSALPKAIAPGLGLGFIVAPPALIEEARRLRRLMVGNPPKSNQRTAAFFISLGHYDAFMMRINKIFEERWNALRDALNHYLPQSILTIPNQGGTAFWVKCPAQVSVKQLILNAAKLGILIESVEDYYSDSSTELNNQSSKCFRMGVTSLEKDRIRNGVERLALLIRELSGSQQITLKQSSLNPLNQQQLKNKLSGATLICQTVYGAPCTIQLCENGKMIGIAGHEDEEADSGRWWVEGDRWFRQWKNWAYGEREGYFVTLNSAGNSQHKEISWFNINGRLIDNAVIQLVSTQSKKLA